jgi:hypothetical protein
MNFPLPPIVFHIFQIVGGILLVHLAILVLTGHAKLGPLGAGRDCRCGDIDEPGRQLLVFGGAAAFDYGLMFWLIGYISLNVGLVMFAYFMLGYAVLRTVTSVLQTLSFFAQTAKAPGTGPFTLKAHLDGCGYTTAISPLWFLYWFQKIPALAWLVYVRDYAITCVDVFFSIPGLVVLNIWTLIVRHVFTIPKIGHVENPRGSKH